MYRIDKRKAKLGKQAFFRAQTTSRVVARELYQKKTISREASVLNEDGDDAMIRCASICSLLFNIEALVDAHSLFEVQFAPKFGAVEVDKSSSGLQAPDSEEKPAFCNFCWKM